MSELTPFDEKYYARPRSENDRKTLAEQGWRELTKQETEEFVKCSEQSGKRDLINLGPYLQSGQVSLRFYRGEGVCVYIKESNNYFHLDDAFEGNKGLTLSDLRNLKERQ
jgi:hypothetical protein